MPRFWEEVQRMGALSDDGCRALSDNARAHDMLARRLGTALRRLDERDAGYWHAVKPELEQAG